MAYSFEPVGTDSGSSSETESDDSDTDRLSDTSWYDASHCRTVTLTSPFHRCECSQCTIMATNTECVCCREMEPKLNKINTLDDSSVRCIIEHPGLNSVCLNVYGSSKQ